MEPRRSSEEAARRQDLALVLPVCGVLALLPPLLNLFTRHILLWDMPIEVIYLFSVWIALILGAVLFSRRVAPGTGGE